MAMKQLNQDPFVFLLDVDNTLLDNDRIEQDLRDHLEQVFGRDACLRYWTIQVGSFTAHEWLKRGWYPFSRIGDEPAIRAAKEQIARAFSNVRASVAEIFAGVDVAGPEKPTSP